MLCSSFSFCFRTHLSSSELQTWSQSGLGKNKSKNKNFSPLSREGSPQCWMGRNCDRVKDFCATSWNFEGLSGEKDLKEWLRSEKTLHQAECCALMYFFPKGFNWAGKGRVFKDPIWTWGCPGALGQIREAERKERVSEHHTKGGLWWCTKSQKKGVQASGAGSLWTEPEGQAGLDLPMTLTSTPKDYQFTKKAQLHWALAYLVSIEREQGRAFALRKYQHSDSLKWNQ